MSELHETAQRTTVSTNQYCCWPVIQTFQYPRRTKWPHQKPHRTNMCFVLISVQTVSFSNFSLQDAKWPWMCRAHHATSGCWVVLHSPIAVEDIDQGQWRCTKVRIMWSHVSCKHCWFPQECHMADTPLPWHELACVGVLEFFYLWFVFFCTEHFFLRVCNSR